MIERNKILNGCNQNIALVDEHLKEFVNLAWINIEESSVVA